jgi:hypothetical protein
LPTGTGWGWWYARGFASLSILAVLTAGFVWLLALPQARFPLLLLVENEYEFPLHPNGWGVEDRKGFWEFSQRPQAPFCLLEPQRITGSKPQDFLEKLKSTWDSLRQSQDERTEVVGVYLAAHGHVDLSCRPFLIPANGDVCSSGTWIPLEEVLSVLAWNGNERDETADSPRVILFLDGARAPVSQASGVSHRDFATAVRKLVDGTGRADLEVWLSADDSQRSLSGEEFGGSLFARLLLVGLAGAADERPNSIQLPSGVFPLVSHGDGSGLVDREELQRFLAENLPRLAANCRGLRQNPVFIASPSPPTAIPMTRAVNGSAWREVWQAGRPPAVSDRGVVPEEDLERAWCDLEQQCHWAWCSAADAGAPVLEPQALDDLRRRLLWAEQAREGGPALAAEASTAIAKCRAELRRRTGRDSISLPQAPSVEEGLKLAIKASSFSAAAPGPVSESLEGLASAADAAWGTDARPGSRRDPRAQLPFLGRLSQLDGQRRVIEDQLLKSFRTSDREVRLVRTQPADERPDDAVGRGVGLAQEYRSVAALRDRYARALAATETVLALGPYFARWHDELADGAVAYTPACLPTERFEGIWKRASELRNALGATPREAQIEELQGNFDLLLQDWEENGPADQSHAGCWPELLARLTGLKSSDVIELTDSADLPRRQVTPREKLKCAFLQTLLESGFPCDAAGSWQSSGTSIRTQLRNRWRVLRREFAESEASAGELPAATGTVDSQRAGFQVVLGLAEDRPPCEGSMTRSVVPPGEVPVAVTGASDRDHVETVHRAAAAWLRAISEREVLDFWPGSDGSAAGFDRLQPLWNLQTLLEVNSSDRPDDLGDSTPSWVVEDRKRLERAESLFARRLRLRCSPLQEIPTGFAQQLTIELDPGGAAWEFPGAQMALRVETQEQTLVGETTVVNPDDGSPPPLQTITLPGGGAAPETLLLEYRGWRRKTGLARQESVSTVSQWERRSPATEPTVQLRLGKGPREDLLLVLDCSNSMAAGAREAAREEPATRFETARTALQTLLEGYLADEQVRVGVWLIGHRVAWSRRESGTLLRQSEYAGGVPDDLRPAVDVESILPLGRFDAAAFELLNRRLETVRPWGETPLYLALSRAIKEHSRGARTSVRRIIAITDGLNYQFNPPPESSIALPELISQARAAQVQISVIGFAMDPEDEVRAQAEYRQFQGTDWTYVSAKKAVDLLPALRKLTQPQGFLVKYLETGRLLQSPVGVPVEVPSQSGTAISIALEEPLDGRPRASSTRLLVPRVVLRGEEAIDLVLDPGTGTAKSALFAEGNPRLHDLVSPDPASAARQLGVHVPRREDRGVVFQFSLRSPEGEVVESPERVWVEVTPCAITETGTTPAAIGLTWVFQEVETEPRTPNPVFRVVCEQWPDRATTARIQIWMGDSPSGGQLVDPEGRIPGDAADGLERVFWMERVEEDADRRQLPRLFVEPEQIDPRSIQRVFVPALGQVRHEFVLAAPPEQAIRLRISDSRVWKSSATTLSKAVDIGIPRRSGNLRPDPVTP